MPRPRRSRRPPRPIDVLKEAREAIVRGLVRIAIHDQPYVQITYSPLDDQGKTLQARVGVESTYPGLSEGDRVTVHSMMNVVTKFVASGDRDE